MWDDGGASHLLHDVQVVEVALTNVLVKLQGVGSGAPHPSKSPVDGSSKRQNPENGPGRKEVGVHPRPRENQDACMAFYSVKVYVVYDIIHAVPSARFDEN